MSNSQDNYGVAVYGKNGAMGLSTAYAEKKLPNALGE
jgi:hypothetical protein